MDQNNYNYEPKRRKGGRVLLFLLSAIILLGSGFLGGWLLGEKNGSPNQYLPQASPAGAGEGAGADWNKLNRIKDQIYKAYDGPIDDALLLEGAIKGMVNSLGDPYSQFFNAKEFKQLNESFSGKFIGVGIQINVENDEIVVVAPIDGSPAKAAGIQSGDVIVRIDDKVYKGKDLESAVNHMRGEAGKPVKLTVRRNKKELSFTIQRAEITQKSVRSELLPGSMGYITMSQFSEKVDVDFKAALDELKAKGAKGYIVDFRGNPGGYLNESIRVASNFIKKGDLVLSTKDKYQKAHEDRSIGGDYLGVPLVLLVDRGSASASEVVAGAWKDYNAAVIVGEKTFGKGIVQSIQPLAHGEGLKLTTAAYYSPKGTSIHKKGIVPDVSVAMPKDLTPDQYTKEKDTQLQKAIEILKGKLPK
ncbi:Carboxyl-terminal protease [Clostridiaceae bacterium JG1575]|nr:Carboxyl-terminal protease [Clostridiaceae bacterium JG1575]